MWEVVNDNIIVLLSEVESSRTSLASRTSSRTHFKVLGLGLEVKSLALASRPEFLENWPVLGSRTALFFELLKFCGALEKFFWKRFFVEIAWKIYVKTFFFFFFFFFLEIAWKIFVKTFFFFSFLESTCACVLGPWPWPQAFLSLASRVSVLVKAVLGLGLGFFLCPWPWPRALCPRLHLCLLFTCR